MYSIYYKYNARQWGLIEKKIQRNTLSNTLFNCRFLSFVISGYLTSSKSTIIHYQWLAPDVASMLQESK